MEPIVKTPIYRESAAYAREHGELDPYRDSHRANIACKKEIEEAIATHFDGMHLDKEAVSEVLERFGAERVALVLAATVQVKSWDGRFSRSNKEWAASVEIPNADVSDPRFDYAVASHPAVLDGFIHQARREMTAPEHPLLQDTEVSHMDMNEKNCAVLLTDAQEIKLIRCEPDADTFAIARKAIGCDWIEIVEPEQSISDGLVMLIDEEGKLKEGGLLNCIASYLYHSDQHGDPIVGGAVIVKAEEDSLELMTEKDAKQIAFSLAQTRSVAIDKIAEAFHLKPVERKQNEMRDAIDSQKTVDSPRQQPCKKKEAER